MECFDVYNKYGEKTGETVERREAHAKGICHRVIHLWIVNAQNQLLFQQRSADKDAGANLWYVSVGGHIESGEAIEATLIRETKEELGLDISGFTDKIDYLFTFKEIKRENDGAFIDDEFYDVFVLKADFPIAQMTLQAEEVQAVGYIGFDAFKKAVASGDKTLWQHEIGYPLLLMALEHYLNIHLKEEGNAG